MEKPEFQEKIHVYKSVYAPDGIAFTVRTDGSLVMVVDPVNGEQMSLVWSEQIRHYSIRRGDSKGEHIEHLRDLTDAINSACFHLLVSRKDDSLSPKPESHEDQVRRFFD